MSSTGELVVAPVGLAVGVLAAGIGVIGAVVGATIVASSQVGNAIADTAISTGTGLRRRINDRAETVRQANEQYQRARAEAIRALMTHQMQQRRTPTIHVAPPVFPLFPQRTTVKPQTIAPPVVGAPAPPAIDAISDTPQHIAEVVNRDSLDIEISALPAPEQQKVRDILQTHGPARARDELNRIRAATEQDTLAALQQTIRELIELARRASTLLADVPERWQPGSQTHTVGEEIDRILAHLKDRQRSADQGGLTAVIARYRGQLESAVVEAYVMHARACDEWIARVRSRLQTLSETADDASTIGVAPDVVQAARDAQTRLRTRLDQIEQQSNARTITVRALQQSIAAIDSDATTAQDTLSRAIDRWSQQRIAVLVGETLAELQVDGQPLGAPVRTALHDGGVRLVAGDGTRGLEVTVTPDVGIAYRTFGMADISCVPLLEALADGLRRRGVSVSEPTGDLTPQATTTTALIQSLRSIGYEKHEITVRMHGDTAVIEATRSGVPAFRTTVDAAGLRGQVEAEKPEDKLEVDRRHVTSRTQIDSARRQRGAERQKQRTS